MSDFNYTLPTYKLDDLESMTQAMHDDGCVLVPGVLSAAEVAAARDAIDNLRPFGFDRGAGLDVDHYKCVFNRDPLFLDLCDRPGIIELAEATMGPQCHIIGESAWRSFPGAGGIGWHIDEQFATIPESAFDDPEYRLPIHLSTVHYYLNDHVNETLCPTYVLPGSHKSGRGPKTGEENTWRDRKPTPVLLKAGDALFFRCEVWHSGSKNVTEDQVRYLLQVHYSHRKIAQKFSPWPWQFNPEILAIATPRQRRLLGEHPESNYG